MQTGPRNINGGNHSAWLPYFSSRKQNVLTSIFAALGSEREREKGGGGGVGDTAWMLSMNMINDHVLVFHKMQREAKMTPLHSKTRSARVEPVHLDEPSLCFLCPFCESNVFL